MPRRALDLRVDARIASRGTIKARDDFQLLLQRMYRETPAVRREPPRIYGLPVVVEALCDIERANLREIEVAHVIASVRTRSARVMRRYIRHAVEVNIVQHHECAVACRDDILLKKIRPHCVGHRFGRQGVLRQIAAGTTMCDHGRHRLNNFNKVA